MWWVFRRGGKLVRGSEQDYEYTIVIYPSKETFWLGTSGRILFCYGFCYESTIRVVTEWYSICVCQWVNSSTATSIIWASSMTERAHIIYEQSQGKQKHGCSFVKIRKNSTKRTCKDLGTLKDHVTCRSPKILCIPKFIYHVYQL